jgi:hypothetical protein
VDFDSPTSNRSTGEGLKLISVRVSPNLTGSSGEGFLEASAKSLVDRYLGVLLSWPYSIQVDEREGVEANYEVTLPFGTETATVIGWEAVFLADNQQWTIEVVGRREYRDELEDIHSQFLSHFHVLPLSRGD